MDALRKFYFFDWAERPLSLHSMLRFCGMEIAVTPEYRWHGLRRGNTEFILWQHTLSGEGALHFEGREYRLGKGDSMLVHIPHDHCYFLPDGSPGWEFVFAGITGKDAIRICRELERRFGPVHSMRSRSPAVAYLRDSVDSACAGFIKDNFTASRIAYNMVMMLASEIDKGKGRDEIPDYIQRAVDLCLNSPGSIPDVDEMAAASGCSRWHFSRMFKASVGMSPGAFVLDHALKRAMAMLQTGSFTVKETAANCGFSSSAVFCRAFKKAYGFSPGRMWKS